MRISISHWGEIDLGPTEANQYVATLTDAIQDEVAKHPWMVPRFTSENYSFGGYEGSYTVEMMDQNGRITTRAI